MDIDDIIDYVTGQGGVLVLRPEAGDGSPEISWGDVFFYYAPDGVVPKGQPFATIVTKDYPDDQGSRLDRPGAFRLNVCADAATFQQVTGRTPKEPAVPDPDPSTPDVLFPHPVYARLGWLAVVNPGRATDGAVRKLLAAAHQSARARHRAKVAD
jgi:hypothetical protein